MRLQCAESLQRPISQVDSLLGGTPPVGNQCTAFRRCQRVHASAWRTVLCLEPAWENGCRLWISAILRGGLAAAQVITAEPLRAAIRSAVCRVHADVEGICATTLWKRHVGDALPLAGQCGFAGDGISCRASGSGAAGAPLPSIRFRLSQWRHGFHSVLGPLHQADDHGRRRWGIHRARAHPCQHRYPVAGSRTRTMTAVPGRRQEPGTMPHAVSPGVPSVDASRTD